MVGERGSPRIERAPSARGPNSMRPCIQPTASPLSERGRGLLDHVLIGHDRETRAGLGQATFHILLCEGRSEKGSLHQIAAAIELALFAQELMPNRKSCADRAAGVTGGRLDPDVLEGAVAQNLAVGNAIERDAAGKTEIIETVLARERTSQPEHDLFGDLLNRGCNVHVERCEQILIRVAHRCAEQIGKFLVGHGETSAIVEIGEIEPERPVVLEVDQVVEDEGSVFRLAVWRKSHELVFAGIDLEAGVVGER